MLSLTLELIAISVTASSQASALGLHQANLREGFYQWCNSCIVFDHQLGDSE